MSKALGTLLECVSFYHSYLAAHPEKALEAPAWSGHLTPEAQTRWRERAAAAKTDTPLDGWLTKLNRKLKGGA